MKKSKTDRIKPTEFGKKLRLLRIIYDMSLAVMAKKLGVSMAWLSAVELGKKPLNMKLLDAVHSQLDITEAEREEIDAAAIPLIDTVKFTDLESDAVDRDLVIALYRNLDNMTNQEKLILITRLKHH